MSPAAESTIAPAARRWLLWLALAIAAAQCVAAWHVYSHHILPRAERSSKDGHAGPHVCGVCLAAAGLGGAPGPAAGWSPTGLQQPEPAPLPPAGRPQVPTARPYAIRAPPLLAS